MTDTQKIMIGHIHTLQKKPKQLSKNKPPILLLHGACTALGAGKVIISIISLMLATKHGQWT